MLLFLDDTRSPTVLIDLKFRQKWSHCRRSPHHSAFFIKCFCEILQYVTVRSDAILRTVILMWKCLFRWRNNWTNHKIKKLCTKTRFYSNCVDIVLRLGRYTTTQVVYFTEKSKNLQYNQQL